MAAAIPLLLPALTKAAEAKTAAMTNDIAVVKWHRPAEVRGKGRARKYVSERDVELHVNPVSVGVGAGALAVGLLAAGFGAWAMGVGVKREEGSTIDRRYVNYFKKDGTELIYQRTVVYSERGRPIKTLSSAPATAQELLTDRELIRNYVVEDQALRIEDSLDSYKEIYSFRFKTEDGGSWKFKERPRWSMDVGLL